MMTLFMEGAKRSLKWLLFILAKISEMAILN